MSFNPIVPTAAASGGSVHSAIALASRKTGVDFNYLLGQAQLESGLRPNARAGTSSATGLYQFIEQSWLAVVKKHGDAHGLGWAANSISTTSSGRMTVSDPGMRRAILELRNDPATASLMAAEHAADNKGAIEGTLGREATGTDLYMAHFLGLGGARSFLGAMQDNPGRIGAAMFPAAANANRNVFYAPNGQPRSLAQIYERFADKLDKGAGVAGGSAPGRMAMADNRADPRAPAHAFRIDEATVIPGADDTISGASDWAQATLDRFDGARRGTAPATQNGTAMASLLRPTPQTARLAYMMLASLGA